MPDRPPIFDFHFHYWPGEDGRGNAPVIRKWIESGALEGILCCTSLGRGVPDPVEANRELFALARELGRGKLPLLASAHPTEPQWRENLERMLDASGEIVGIKLHPPVGRYEVTLETVGPAFEFAEERSLMVASHTCPVPGKSAISFLPALEAHPDVVFIVYHASTHEESAYLSIRKNVYVEPTWLGFYRETFDMALKLGGRHKLLAGTDGPGWFDGFEGDPYDDLCELSRRMIDDEEVVADFLYGNAAKLLGL